MKKNYKKIFRIGIIITPILIGTSLISSSSIVSNKSSLTITNKVNNDKLLIRQNSIIDKTFVDELIQKKKDDIFPSIDWNGILVADDFAGKSSVADQAFQNNNDVRQITLPTSVLTIGASAFSRTTNLTTISALGVKSIGARAFSATDNMSEHGIKLRYSSKIKLPNAQNWGTTPNKLDIADIPTKPIIPQNGIINPTFITKLIDYKKSMLATGDIWDGILVEDDFTNATSVADGAFQSNTEIKSITLPTSVLTIGANAFNGASALTSISALGATSIGNNAFAGLHNITGSGNSKINLTFSENIKIPNFDSWGTRPDKLNIIGIPTKPEIGAIIDAAFVNELIIYENSKLPTGTPWDGILDQSDFIGSISIADGAFQNNTQIKSITLTKRVLTIGDNAFNGASNLTNISALGATSIGANAFAGTTSIDNEGIKLTFNENIKPSNAETWGITDINKLAIANTPIKPLVPENGIITPTFVNELIDYKKSMLATGDIWDGILVESDFANATSVADGAFQNNTEIKSITLPTSVLKIGLDAFNGASALTTISALGAIDIAPRAFNGTTSIIPSGIKLTKSANINVDQAASWGTTAGQLDITLYVPTPPSDDQNMIYIIIGAIIGSLLLIGGIVGGVLFYRKKVNESDSSKNKSKDKKEKESKKDKGSKDKKEKESKKDKDSKEKKDKDLKDDLETKSIDNDENNESAFEFNDEEYNKDLKDNLETESIDNDEESNNN